MSLLHEVAREAPAGLPSPSAEDRQAFVAQMQAKVVTSHAFTAKRKASLQARLDLASAQSVPGDTFYAAQRIEERAHVAKVALDDYYNSTARELGESVAKCGPGCGPPTWSPSGNGPCSRPPNGSTSTPLVPVTGHSRWTGTPPTRCGASTPRSPSGRARCTSVPTVANHQPVRGAGVRAVGYDRETGRLEVEFRSRPGHSTPTRMCPRCSPPNWSRPGRPTPPRSSPPTSGRTGPTPTTLRSRPRLPGCVASAAPVASSPPTTTGAPPATRPRRWPRLRSGPASSSVSPGPVPPSPPVPRRNDSGVRPALAAAILPQRASRSRPRTGWLKCPRTPPCGTVRTSVSKHAYTPTGATRAPSGAPHCPRACDRHR